LRKRGREKKEERKREILLNLVQWEKGKKKKMGPHARSPRHSNWNWKRDNGKKRREEERAASFIPPKKKKKRKKKKKK